MSVKFQPKFPAKFQPAPHAMVDVFQAKRRAMQARPMLVARGSAAYIDNQNNDRHEMAKIDEANKAKAVKVAPNRAKAANAKVAPKNAKAVEKKIEKNK